MGLIFISLAFCTIEGGMPAKSFLSSLMAVSTRALSGFDSVTYVRLLAHTVAAERAGPLKVALSAELRPRRAAERIAVDEMLAILVCRLNDGMFVASVN